jgi:hypothetical protein
MLSVHAVHFTLQSSFQAQNSTTTEQLRPHTGGILRQLRHLANLRQLLTRGVDSLISASRFLGFTFSFTCSEVGWDL